MLKRNRNNMPEGFEPPVPAWGAEWEDADTILVTAIFAVQGEDGGALKDWVMTQVKDAASQEAPLESATFEDLAGVKNTVFISYWHKRQYDSWWDQAQSWWADQTRVAQGHAYWREIYSVTPDRLETLHSTPNSHGIAAMAPELFGPVEEHAYPGAMRDRIPISADHDLKGSKEVPGLTAVLSDGGKRIRLQPPNNFCVIRSGQDWTHCTQEEAEFYINALQPKLQTGMAFLSENPKESRCLCMRLMNNVDSQGEKMQQTFGLGYAIDIFAFEEWAKSHPTHVDIFDRFMEHAGRFGEDMNLRLWHEVSVVDADSGDFEYINCHPQTGLLRFIDTS